MAADICVIQPGGVTPHATYEAPRESATGIDLVIVNGAIVWRNGRPLATQFPGQFVN